MIAADPRWVAAVDGELELVADVDPNLWFEIEVKAGLSGLSTRWTQGPYFVDGEGHVKVRLAPPSDAFLHEVALDYLTVVRVRLVGVDAAGRTALEVRAPNVFLAWPSGRAAGPVVWDRATAEIEAPNGVVNDTLRASFGDLPERAWVQPSMAHAVRNSDVPLATEPE